ncbi:MAG TPA: S9 family peptidase [Acidobacteriota bacterium]|nr:S9 family peptidase [Acidobacteriota bacterium]
MRLTVILLIGVIACPGLSARTITFDDLYGLPRCEDVQISPDGERVVFVLNTADLGNNTSQSHLWIMSDVGDDLRQLTFGPSSNWHPRWSSDGRSLLFLSDRGGDDQVWLLPIQGGEAGQVTDLGTGVEEFACSPSGDNLMLVSRVFPDCRTDSCNRARLAWQEENPEQPRLYDRLLFRRYDHWDDGRINKLFLTHHSGKARQMPVAGPFDAPTSLLGGYGDFTFSHDGEEACFSMSADSMPAVCVNNDLWVVRLPEGEPVRLTAYPGQEVSPRYSPDGRYLAFHKTERAAYESDQYDLVIRNRRDSGEINLTSAFDRSVGEYAWSPDSRYIYFAAIEHGFRKIWRVEIESSGMEMLLDSAVYGDLCMSPDGKYLVVHRSLPDQPGELYRFDLDTRSLTRLTRFTDNIAGELKMSRADDFWFAGALGDSVQGFITTPPGFDPTRTYPLVLLIHGGPQWCWLRDFNYYGWNTQLVAAQGYVVVQVNPHGSIGYGRTFKEYVSGNWGKGDFEDLMKGVDYVVDNFAYVDSSRMAALGRSFGGFMVNWICGHTDRFTCLVSVDGTSNHLSNYGSTDELWFPESEFDGTPWTNRQEYVRSSPLTYAESFRTPTMVIHGQGDYRVDLSEGLQMFTALQRMGVPSRLLCFPDEGHQVQKLGNLRYVYEKQFEWLARWLTPR